MSDFTKVRPSHTRRFAFVYIRQSSPSQVENNRESTARQYALVEKACDLGWAKEQVIVIDEDLGLSGSGWHLSSFAFQRSFGPRIKRHNVGSRTSYPARPA